MAAGVFLRVAKDDPADLETLLAGILAHLRESGLMGLALVLHERDPLRPALEAFWNLRITSRLCGVGWADSEPWFTGLDGTRVPYADAAFL
jgi:hypothetical protein